MGTAVTTNDGDYDSTTHRIDALSGEITYQKRNKHVFGNFSMNSRLILLLVCWLLFCVDMAHGRCANSCSGHGTCNLNVCVCFTGWNGGAADCSMRKYNLSKLWLCYAISVPFSSVDVIVEDRCYYYYLCINLIILFYSHSPSFDIICPYIPASVPVVLF